jgi:hypothetical protein
VGRAFGVGGIPGFFNYGAFRALGGSYMCGFQLLGVRRRKTSGCICMVEINGWMVDG